MAFYSHDRIRTCEVSETFAPDIFVYEVLPVRVQGFIRKGLDLRGSQIPAITLVRSIRMNSHLTAYV